MKLVQRHAGALAAAGLMPEAPPAAVRHRRPRLRGDLARRDRPRRRAGGRVRSLQIEKDCLLPHRQRRGRMACSSTASRLPKLRRNRRRAAAVSRGPSCPADRRRSGQGAPRACRPLEARCPTPRRSSRSARRFGDVTCAFYSGGASRHRQGITHLAPRLRLSPQRRARFWECRADDVVFATSKSPAHGLWPSVRDPLWLRAARR